MATVRADGAPGGPVPALGPAPASRRRRRPSGEPPPLPRHVDPTAQLYLALAAVIGALQAALALRPVRSAVLGLDGIVARALEQARPEPVEAALRAVALLGSPWPVRAVFWCTVAVLLAFRRAHALLAFLGLLVGTSLLAGSLAVWQGRARPVGVTAAVDWAGYAHPSLPVALLAAALVGAVRVLLPAGAWRRRGTAAAAGLVVALAVSRVWLGVDGLVDALAGLGLGWALPAAALGLALPDEAFPVRYRGGRGAHVDLAGGRGAAVALALRQQLGLPAAAVEPFGLAGSAGSMPLRVRLEDGRSVFAKLYTVTHLRADRLYKLARTVLYGRLEDEKPFSTVRRLVEYEDHMLRLLRDAGLPVPAPLGLVEVTPEREYVLAMEFVEGGQEIGEAPVTDEVVDDGLRIVRRLWEAGVAHRDVKPSNLLVRDGRVVLIDVAFAAARPTPWRQAVDLANMMLTLALSTSAERVYARALRQFAPEDVAEAFAASRSVTLPTQLRSRLRADGRDLPRRFRELAPARSPVPVQLWSLRRALVTAGALAAVGLSVAGLVLAARVADLL
jgi:tRNA A-37 threonylcarbamoyl transferase component Bud32